MSKNKITEEEVNQMGKLEQLFHNRYLTPEFLHQLISIYVKAIELFNQEYKFMRSYFMDKMQFVLSRPEIITLLEGGGEAVDNIRETIRMTERVMPVQHIRGGQESSLMKKQDAIAKDNLREEKQKKVDDRFQNYRPENNIHKVEQHHHYHYDQSKLNKKNNKIDMKMKLMREVQENMKNFKKQVYQAEQIFTKNQQKVKGITKNQQQLLNERLMKRKKRLRKKSVQIKAAKPEGQQNDEIPEPAIKKEQLVEAQRQLTQAVYKFTVRMTQRTRQKQMEEGNKIKGRVKKIKDLDDDEILLQQNDEQEEKDQQKKMGMKKNKPANQQNGDQRIQGRVKTIRRHQDSDDD